MHSHRNITTDNEAPENAPLNIFCIKWDIYFHFTEGIQSTISTHNHNCKHLIRNCNNELTLRNHICSPQSYCLLQSSLLLYMAKQKGPGLFPLPVRPAGRRQLVPICLDTLPPENRGAASHLLLGKGSCIVWTPEQSAGTVWVGAA